MWPLRTILYFVAFWVGCFAAILNPIWGVANYMMAYQMNPPITWWGTPLVNIGMRFSLLAVGFTVLGLFTARKRVPNTSKMGSMWEVGIFALIGIAILNALVFGVEYGPAARHAFEKFWKLQVFVLILTRLATTRRNLKLVIWTLVGGSFYLGYDAYTAPYRSFVMGRLEAFGGPDISTSSGAAAHLTAMLPIIGVAFLVSKVWYMRAAAAIAGAFTLNAIVLCRTRSAFIGIMVGAMVAVLAAPKMRRFRIHMVLLLGGVAAFSLTDANYWNRMRPMGNSEEIKKDAAAMSRWEIAQASVGMLADYPLGVGLGNYSRIIGRYDARYRHKSSHNTVITAFCELGIVGGLLFLSMCAGSIFLLLRSCQDADMTDDPLETKLMAYGMLVSIVSYFVAGLGTERFSCESFWWVLCFPLCLRRLVWREMATRVEQPMLGPIDVIGYEQSAWRQPHYGV